MKFLRICFITFVLVGCSTGNDAVDVSEDVEVLEEVFYDRLEPTNESQIVNRERLPEVIPDDFNIVLKYGVRPKNVIDTFEGTISKDMIIEDTITISYKFTDLQLESIYSTLQSISIEKYPNFFVSPYKQSEIREYGGEDPYIIYDLYYMFNGELYNVRWEDSYPGISLEDHMGDDLRSALNNIIDIIEDLEEYKKLPEPNSGYE